PGGHLARVTQRRDGDLRELCDWVLVDHQAADQARHRGPQGYRFGKAFATPVPKAAPSAAQQWQSPRHEP
ncbi:MAG TPA: hypothetical protein VGV61_00585, partial [Thermoanaerobaculia bacterium]|nr:hypothetical protein [Thermoanaerobaculia bacterium]